MHFKEKDGKIVSPFHDIPLYADPSEKSIVNMVVEIPRWSNAKIEVILIHDTSFSLLTYQYITRFPLEKNSIL
jgi:hypothetical protein